MRFCDADACCSCALAEGGPDCLRHKADFCFSLAIRFPRAGAALNKLGLHLIADAEARERERAVVSRCNPGPDIISPCR